MTFRHLSLHFLIRSSHLSRLRQVFGKTWSTTDKSFSPATSMDPCDNISWKSCCEEIVSKEDANDEIRPQQRRRGLELSF
ncbi:hypothetical protein ACFX1Q_000884 [Malus domestica]